MSLQQQIRGNLPLIREHLYYTTIFLHIIQLPAKQVLNSIAQSINNMSGISKDIKKQNIILAALQAYTIKG